MLSGEIFGRMIVFSSKYIPTMQIAYDEKLQNLCLYIK